MNQHYNQPMLNQDAQPLSPEVVAFCALVARIINRCLREQDPRIFSLLGVSPVSQEVAHEQAA